MKASYLNMEELNPSRDSWDPRNIRSNLLIKNPCYLPHSYWYQNSHTSASACYQQPLY